MGPRTRILLIVLAAFVAAIAGVMVGRALTGPAATPAAELHAVLHDGLDLNGDQKLKLESLERLYAIRRSAIELQMRADNAALAAAIETEHGYGPGVAAAVDRAHTTMGELQRWSSTGRRGISFGIRRSGRRSSASKAAIMSLSD